MYCLWLRKTQYLCGFTLDYYNATPTIMNVHNGLMSTMSILFLLCLGLEPLVDGAQTGYEYKYTTTVDFRCDL